MGAETEYLIATNVKFCWLKLPNGSSSDFAPYMIFFMYHRRQKIKVLLSIKLFLIKQLYVRFDSY